MMREVMGALAALAVAVACDRSTPPMKPAELAAVVPSVGPGDSTAVLVGAGDIADCRSRGAEETARLIDGIPGAVMAVGDLAYPRGTVEDVRRCYRPTWGRFRDRTFPALGNHDVVARGAAGYVGFFGERLRALGPAAADPARGWYSYRLGAWHVVVLNSNPASVDSAQVRWLREDLRANRQPCTLAYFHHPRFTSGPHGDAGWMQPIWQALYDGGVDVAVAGHDHDYERFVPMDAAGRPDEARGIRSFVVGTGGAERRRIRSVDAGSVARMDDTFGVIRFVLRPGTYEWDFIPTGRANQSIDHGKGTCH
jgi:hypothetical protein